jgi:hypothetical protein
MFTRPNCVDCRTLAPETNTYYTLIGPTHGWRMTRTAQGGGKDMLVEWRCAPCWRKYKAAAAAAGRYPSSGQHLTTRAARGSSVPPEGTGTPPKPSTSR